ncbi:MAG: FtsX-like permease family protein [Cellulosilyticaceae bacterium]
MQKKSLIKDASREIKKSLGRFFSIMAIVALGVAFLAGIKVSSPMMKDTTDQYMDDYDMMDVRILSTVGIETADREAIGKLEQVESITGSHSINALTTIEGNQTVVKVHSLQKLAKEESGWVNKPMLIEGRWPSAPNECLIDGTELTRLPLKVGDTLTLKTGTDAEMEDVLAHETYEVVGVMNSPYYMHYERGTAEIGNGSVASYLYIPEENFKSDIYTELFITLKGAKSLDSYSDDYTELVDTFKTEVTPLMEERAYKRYEKLLDEGMKELEEGEAKFSTEKEKANQELEKAGLKLQQGKEAILENEKKLIDGQKQANEGFAKAEEALRQAALELEENEKHYEEGLKLFEVEKEKTIQQLEVLKVQIQTAKKQVDALAVQLKSIEEQLQNAEDGAQEALLEQKLQLEKQLVDQMATLQVDETIYEKSVAELKKQEESLTATGVALSQGLAQLETQKLALAREKDATLSGLEKGMAQLAEAKATLEEGDEKYTASKAEAEEQLKDAEEALVKGREQLENLKEPKVYVLGREANYGVANYKNAVQTIERIGKIFPLFFFVVAALVCLTTMTRMVDEQRITMGTYKALGYSTMAIMSKYLLYAGIASVVGSLVGILVGFKVFPNTIYNAYGMMFTAPPLISKFYPKEALSAIIIMTALTVFAAAFTTMKALKEQPTELMRPKAPPAGKRILLERIPFVWKRMNFFQKVVARNIFRYKKKFFMTTIGIAGCTALLVAGLGLKQSIVSIVDRQYGDLYRYDLEISLKENETTNLKEHTAIKDVLEVRSENVKVLASETDRAATLRILPEQSTDEAFIQLRERVSQAPLTLGEGAIISEKLAQALHLQVGDSIAVEKSNLETYQVKVTGITENYIGHAIYVSDAYMKQLTGKRVEPNQLLVQLNDLSDGQVEALSEELIKDTGVMSFAFASKHAESFASVTESLDTVVMILVVSAALLASVVLYNLTTINISERYREIATIKVLGFDDFKVSQYIYRENIVLTLIGALMGLGLGKALFLFIIVTAEMDEMMFGRQIYGSSYLWGMLLTFVFAMAVNVLMHFKLQKIEMVESLKSVE